MGKLVIALARILPLCTLVWVLVPGAPVFGQSREQWQKFMEDAAGQVPGVMPPPGVEDVVSSLRSTKDDTKSNLQLWLQSKMRDAALADDMDRVDRYYAFYHCLSTNDCSHVQRLQGKILDISSIYSREFKIILTIIFIFIGSTAFYVSSLICGHNIYRDFSHNISIFITSIVGFLLFIFSPISFIVLFPSLFTKYNNDIYFIINEIHFLAYRHALTPFVLSSIGIGMIFGSFTLIRARYVLLRWFREWTGLHYLIYTYQFAWDRFLSSIKRRGKVQLLLKSKDTYPKFNEQEGGLVGELIYFSVREEPKEIVIKNYESEDKAGILVNDFKDVQGIIVPHTSFNKYYDPMRDDSKAFYLCLASLGFFFLAMSANQTSKFLVEKGFENLSHYYRDTSTLLSFISFINTFMTLFILKSGYKTWKAFLTLCELAIFIIGFEVLLLYFLLRRILKYTSFGIPEYGLNYIDYTGIILAAIFLWLFYWIYGERKSIQQFFSDRIIDMRENSMKKLHTAIEDFWINYDLSEEFDNEDFLIKKARREKYQAIQQKVLKMLDDIRNEKTYLKNEKTINLVYHLLLYVESKPNLLARRSVEEMEWPMV